MYEDVQYNWKITSVDKDTKTMIIEYSSEGLPTLTVGALMPTGSETVEDVVKSYVPLNIWGIHLMQPNDVEVGMTGSSTVGESQFIVGPEVGLPQIE
jgi:5,10-methenyltetrahydromethanopterin hydrogenase